METDKREAARRIQVAWKTYAPYHRLTVLKRLLSDPPALATGQHDTLVRRLTAFLTTGDAAPRKEFVCRAHACGLYPFPLAELKLADESSPSHHDEKQHGSHGLLWSEMVHAENGLPLLKAASVVSLIQCLVSDAYNSLESSFLEDFLLTYRTFLTPHALLLMLILRYWIPLGQNEERKKECIPIQIKTVRVLRMWIELVPSDFVEGHLLAEHTRHFLNGIDTFKIASSEILKLLEEKLDQDQEYSDGSIPTRVHSGGEREREGGDLNSIDAEKSTPVHRNRSKSNATRSEPFSFLSFDATDVAYVWTLISQRIYRSVTPKEFVKQAWNKKTRRRDAPNVSTLIEDFNQMSEWVALVVLSYRDKKRRGAALSHFIQIAWECHRLKNYHVVMIILSGLTKAHITRLKKSWEFVDGKVKSKLKLLNEIMNMEGNFQQYRQALREMSSATPSIPFLGLLLTDLTFLDEGNLDFVSSLEHSALFPSSAPSSGTTALNDSTRASQIKRRSLFKIKPERTMKPDAPQPKPGEDFSTVTPSASSTSVPMKGSEKRRSTIRSFSVSLKGTSEKIRLMRGRKSTAFATFDESALASGWRNKASSADSAEARLASEEEEAASRAWKQLDDDLSKSSSENIPRAGCTRRVKRAPQIFDMNELTQAFEREKEKEEHAEITDTDRASGTNDKARSKTDTTDKKGSAQQEETMLVNWMKKRTMAKILREFLRFQNCTYVLPKRREKKRRRQRSKSDRKSGSNSLDQITNEGGGSKDSPLLSSVTSSPDIGEMIDEFDASEEHTEAIRNMLGEMRLPPDIANVLDLSSLFPSAFAPTFASSLRNSNSPDKRPRAPSNSSVNNSSPRSRSSTSLQASSHAPPLNLADIVSKPEDLIKSPLSATSLQTRRPSIVSPRNITQAVIKRSTSMPSININSTDDMIVTPAAQSFTPRGGRSDQSATIPASVELPTSRDPADLLAGLLTMKYIKLDDNLLFGLSLHLEPRSTSQLRLSKDNKSLFVINSPQASPVVTNSARVRDKIDRSSSIKLLDNQTLLASVASPVTRTAASTKKESDDSLANEPDYELSQFNGIRRVSLSGPAAAIHIQQMNEFIKEKEERSHSMGSPCVPEVPGENLTSAPSLERIDNPHRAKKEKKKSKKKQKKTV